MDNLANSVARSIARHPHSFDHIRKATGLALSDDQLYDMIKENNERFKLLHFVKRDGEGKSIQPGRPGIRLRATAG
jgi:hypothetical protein